MSSKADKTRWKAEPRERVKNHHSYSPVITPSRFGLINSFAGKIIVQVPIPKVLLPAPPPSNYVPLGTGALDAMWEKAVERERGRA